MRVPADTLLRTHERDSRILKASPADHAISLELAQQVKDILNRTIVFSSPDAINYTWTAALLDVARKHTDLLARAMPWDFPEDLSVGNLTFRDIRRFWGVLLTIVDPEKDAFSNPRTAFEGGVAVAAPESSPIRAAGSAE